MELISLIIPIYKPNFHYLNEINNSLKTQSYSNFEVILSIDDFETSIEQIQSVFSNDNCIIILNNSNEHGIFGNINFSLSYAKGKFIQFLCQDDIPEMDFLNLQLDALNEYPEAGFVYTQVNHIDSKSELINKNNDQYLCNTIYFNPDVLKKILFKYGCLPGNLSTVMIRRELLNSVGIFNSSLTFAGDFDYWIRCSENKSGGMVVNLNKHLKLRTHSERASNILGNVKWSLDMIHIYNDFINKNPTFKRFSYIIYLNESLGVQFVKILIKQLKYKKYHSFKKIFIQLFLSKYIFTSISLILLVFDIFKIKIFKLNKIQLNFPIK